MRSSSRRRAHLCRGRARRAAHRALPLPARRRDGYAVHPAGDCPGFCRRAGEVRPLLRVMLPGVFGSGVVQINLLVSTAIASLLPTGAVSYLSYADRLNQLPLALVGIAVGTAILPPLSRQVRTGDSDGASHTQNRGLELALLLTLPAAIALAVAAH